VTDLSSGESPAWAPVLRDFARASGHELRNALNALVVNLEVVRSRSDNLDPSVRSFVTQAIEQSEESVRLAEGTIALLNMIVGAVGHGGSLEVDFVAPRGLSIQSSESTAARTAHALSALVSRTPLNAEATATAVILSIPETDEQE
jgi:signal transduction histidine kinase